MCIRTHVGEDLYLPLVGVSNFTFLELYYFSSQTYWTVHDLAVTLSRSPELKPLGLGLAADALSWTLLNKSFSMKGQIVFLKKIRVNLTISIPTHLK